MSQKNELWRAAKFTLFSISAGIIQIVTFTLLNELLNWKYWPCYLIALSMSVIWNFSFNRKFTFQSAGNIPVAMIKTLAFYAVFTPLSTMFEYYLADLNGWNEYIVTVINMLINFVLEYLYQRYYVFNKSVDTANKKS
mgnify:CR=1 FL=1